MRLPICLIAVFISCLSATTLGQQAKLEGQVFDDKGRPVSGVRVNAPGGQAAPTDSKGHFNVAFTPSVKPGQAVRIFVANWKVFDPMFGECWTQSMVRSKELLKVTVVAPNSIAAHLKRERLGAIVAVFQKQVQSQIRKLDKLNTKVDELEYQRQKYDFLQKYEEEYGVPLEKIKTALDDWALAKDAKDKLEQVRQQYWLGNWDNVIALTEKPGPFDVELLKQRNQLRRKASIEDSRKTIEFHIYEGNALFQRYRFSESLASFRKIEQLFNSGEVLREDLPQVWVLVRLSLGNAKREVGKRDASAEGLRLLEEALVIVREAETLYSREIAPREWAVTHIGLGIVLSDLGERSEGVKSLQYLHEAVVNLRAGSEVITRAQLPQEWAGNQVLLGTVLRVLGARADGVESLTHLRDAVAAYRSSLELFTVAQLPASVAETESNLGVVLTDLGNRSVGVESVQYLDEAQTTLRSAVEIFTRLRDAEGRALAQHNLAILLRILGARSEGDKRLKYLTEAETRIRAALEVMTRPTAPTDWVKMENTLAVILSDLAQSVEGPERLKYLKEAESALRAVLEISNRTRMPHDWAVAMTNLGLSLIDLGENSTLPESLKYLNDGAEAFRAAMEVRTRAQFPQDWAATQSNLGIALIDLAKQSDGAESVRYLKEADEGYRAVLLIFTRERMPEWWAATQLNRGIVLNTLSERSAGAERVKNLNEAGTAFRSALEIFSDPQVSPWWAVAQSNLARTYELQKEWERATEILTHILHVYPDDAEAYGKAASIYQDELFRFDQAFALHKSWLGLHANDLQAQADFAEAHFTTGRFVECRQRITALLARPEVPVDVKLALRGIEIASLLATNQAAQVSSRLDALIAEVSSQDPKFKIEWRFDGDKYFVSRNENLSSTRAWLEQLFEALTSKDRDALVKALQAMSTKLKEQG